MRAARTSSLPTASDKGAVFSRPSSRRICLLLPIRGGAEIVWGNERLTVTGHSVTFVPAGKSSSRCSVRPSSFADDGEIEDLAALCSNVDSYASRIRTFRRSNVAERLRPKIRTYSLEVAPTPAGSRIWRGSTSWSLSRSEAWSA